MNNTGLSPWQWQVLEGMLPRNPRIGRPYRDHRQVVEGILWRLRSGAPWREVPTRYGPWRTCHARLLRWQRDGTWLRVLHALQGLQADSIAWDHCALDATHVRLQRSAHGARKPRGHEAIGRSRGGPSSKLHLIAEAKARPLAAHLTPGHASDAANLLPTLEQLRVPLPSGRVKRRPQRLILDRAYGARVYRQQLRRLHIRAVIPERADARQARLRRGRRGGRAPAFDALAYRLRNAVERCINRLKDFRAIATRYDKTAHAYLAGVHFAMILLWLPPN